MRIFKIISASLIFAIAACGPAAGPPDADAQTGQAAATAGEITAADRSAILGALHLSANGQGLVENECGDRVAPQFLAAQLGGAAGAGVLFAIGGGPSAAACYGDGPDLHLFVRDGAGWREVYSARGRMLIILPTSTRGVHDIADGGPGFSFPVWAWNGTVYAPANREIGDSALDGATYLP
jgi:hypothetical protein